MNRARVYAPFPVVGGSSISHYDTVASRNLLMEPAINADLTHNVKAPFDLTWELLQDVGWTFPDADGDAFADDEDCKPTSDVRPTIVIGGSDTGVPNRGLGSGCTMTDTIVAAKAAATQPGSVHLRGGRDDQPVEGGRPDHHRAEGGDPGHRRQVAVMADPRLRSGSSRLRSRLSELRSFAGVSLARLRSRSSTTPESSA